MDIVSDGVTVRLLGRTDLDRLVRMDEALTGRNRSVWYERKLQRALHETDIRISLGAEHDGVLVGALLGSLLYWEFGQPEPVAQIDTILVDRPFAGRGVGTALVDQLLRNLAALGIERVRTEVGWEEHELARFLGRRGFAPLPRLVLEAAVAAPPDRDAEVPEEEISAG
jgi:GNAT superfamily N-acetyltransferase